LHDVVIATENLFERLGGVFGKNSMKMTSDDTVALHKKLYGLSSFLTKSTDKG
jgi:hypothetical protein